MDSARQKSMRTPIILFVLVCSLFAPIASAGVQTPHDSILNDTDDSNIISSYSPIIQAAIAHKSDLSMYSNEELESTMQWVVFAAQFDGEAAKELPGAWIVDVNPETVVDDFSQLIEEGMIEAAYPLVEKVMPPRWVPNDPLFSDQWHLQNTGQSGGTSGEDVNITGAWNSYKGSGVVIGIVDDGLDWACLLYTSPSPRDRG